jgi:sugar lactone lactonase YvrE
VISNVVQNDNQGDAVMNPFGARSTLRFAVVAMLAVTAGAVYSQSREPINSLPNPYRSITDWAKMRAGRTWGSTAGVDVDRDGSSVWVAERCGAFAPPSSLKPGVPFACDGSKLDPILKFDASGKLVKAFGAGMFLFPHGLHVDHDGNVWVTDGLGNDGKGQQVIKFSPDGKELMRLGKAGVAGSGPDEFNAPSAVYVAPDGNVFVADGHGGDTNARIVKFTKDGKFIKSWGQKGTGPLDLDIPHALAMDSRGRLFVADRNNNRIQIYDQDGKLLDSWSQFSRPSGIAIDKSDRIYVVDSESGSVNKAHGAWKRGMRIGSAVDGSVTAFIPDPDENATTTSAAEGVAVDSMGNLYGAEVGPKRLMRYVKN